MARTLLVLFLLVLPTRLAFASEEADKARATGLFAEAQALAEAGSLGEACPKFEESVKARAGVGNRFHLADCWEKTGRTASAHALFVEVAAVTRELGQTEREQAALERAKALETKLVRLRVEVSQPNESVELTCDGKVIAKEAWGKATAVDPGSHELRASAKGKETWAQKVEVPADPGTVLITVPALADAKPPVVAAPAAKTTPKKKPAEPAPKESEGAFRPVATISLVGLGVAGVVTGVAMSAQYLANQQDAEAICPEGVGCTEEQVKRHEELVNDARSARTWAFVGFGAGAAALTGAALLHFTAPSKDAGAHASTLRPEIFVSSQGAFGALRGGF